MLRRSQAQKLCDAGYIKMGGVKAKSAKEVKPGDNIEIKRGNKLLTVAVRQIPSSKQVSREMAAELYEVVSETTIKDDPASDLLFEMDESSSKPAP